MRKVRIMWGVWLLIMAVLLIFTNNYGIQIIALLSVILPSAGIVFGFLGSGKLKVDVKGQISQKKGCPLTYSIQVKNEGRIGCSKGKAIIKLENMLTGENEKQETAFSIRGRQAKVFECSHVFQNCGKIRITLEEIQSWDFIGAYGRKNKTHSVTNALSIPDTFHIELSMGAGAQTDLSSDEYSMLKSGFDPSETFALREYRPGDKIKNIHWKLSEKLDEITVRELGLPVNNSVLLMLDSSYPAENSKPEHEVMDAIGETVISIAQELCDNGVPFQVAWYDSEASTTQVREIMNIDDLSSAMSGVLSATPFEDGSSVLSHFKEDAGPLEYAHIIIVGSVQEPQMESSFCEGFVSNLICMKNEKPSDIAAAAGQIIYFTPETMAEDLYYVEV